MNFQKQLNFIINMNRLQRFFCIFIAIIGILFSGISLTTTDLLNRNAECKLAEPDLVEEMSNITEEFGNVFEKATKELNKLPKTENINSVVLIGNTGAGKSTLAQLITGWENLQSVPTYPDSDNFIITDGDIIGTETITSKTLYPNLIKDVETGIIICDSPGFKDTRSPIHELIAATFMKTVIKKLDKIKIVLVVNHASLMKGSFRDDFTNLLKQTIDFVKDIDKYKDSLYLVATKVENAAELKKGKLVFKSDETIIKGIHYFLEETKSSLLSISSPINNNKKNEMVKLIEWLMQRNGIDGVAQKIKIFKKPFVPGSLQEMDIIRQQRLSLREMLLGKENFAAKNDDDFGYSVSSSAKLYVNEIFSFSDKFMTSLSNQIAKYLIEYYNNTLTNIEDARSRLIAVVPMKLETIQLGNELGKSKRPSDFVDKVTKFSLSNHIIYSCQLNLLNITILNNYTEYLENFFDVNKLVESRWNSSFKFVNEFFETEFDNYVFLEKLYRDLSNYGYQKKKHEIKNVIMQQEENEINRKNFLSFLQTIGLNYNNDNTNLKPNGYTIDMINRAIGLLVKSDIKITCEGQTLRVVGYIIKLSDIDDSVFKNCYGFANFVIFAMDTLFIDKDLDQVEFAGKQVLIIARVWHTVGNRRIKVDGKSGKDLPREPKAEMGRVGKNGKNGGSGGIFIGIGEVFEYGYNLKISANGGSGQDGQDGGDGQDGYDGSNGVHYSSRLSDNSRGIYVVYNSYTSKRVYEGTPGTEGGNSGAGGKGGSPGAKGSVILHSNSQSTDKNAVSIEVKDGKRGYDGADGIPGKGGMGGCDKVITEKTYYALFFPVSNGRDVSWGSCHGRKSNGYVVRNSNDFKWSMPSITLTPFDKCKVIKDYKNTYEREYKSHKFSKLTDTFIDENIC